MGPFLKQMPKAKGGANYHDAESPRAPGDNSEPSATVTTRADIGIEHHQARRAVKLADIPEQEFQERIVVAKIDGKLSTAKVLQPARRAVEIFNLNDWKRHTATMLDLRFRSVPDEAKQAAVTYTAKFIERYLP